ncbi:hypothetical protein C2G38_2217641 [Gigaspora rosea]|uniref:BACK domain-containing protein n=1 Tax=Gigaspora rosea TaxID=44941 RepID=A0A397UB12_9GLOM|nr:hypothetical protein C2G38_2217641 [Gigaspora rosea]
MGFTNFYPQSHNFSYQRSESRHFEYLFNLAFNVLPDLDKFIQSMGCVQEPVFNGDHGTFMVKLMSRVFDQSNSAANNSPHLNFSCPVYLRRNNLENNDNSFIFELMLIAYEFLFEELAKYLETHLNKKLQELQKWCNDIVVKSPNKIIDSENFTSLQENALVSFISRDNLQMEEVKIWNRVIEWEIAQNPGLPSNPEDWSNENFLTLKTTLRNCSPLIHYFQMYGVDIIDNVQPYQQILEKNLLNDIVKKFIVQKSFSMIISDEHAAKIALCVDRKDDAYSVTNNPYECKLLLRRTKDGFTK